MSDFNLLELVIIFSILGFSALSFIYFYFKGKNEEKNCDMSTYYEKKIKKLTSEQIEEIHKSGHIIPEEKLKEIEDFGLCAPGDAIGSATWRCNLFECDCHKCLCDYVASKDEWGPFDFKVVNSIDIKEKDFYIQKLE